MQLIPEFNGPGVSASPGVCYLCGANRRSHEIGIIATERFIEVEGMLELCAACITEAGALVGLISAEKAEGLRTRNRELGRKAQIAEEKLSRLEHLRRICAEVAAL